MIREIFGGVMPLIERALDIGYARHKVLSSNIANEETPGYKARDIEFQQELDNKMTGGIRLIGTHGQHFSGAGPIGSGIRVAARKDDGAGFDNNSVSLEKEMVKMSENTMIYNAHATFLSKKFQGLREAIKEGR